MDAASRTAQKQKHSDQAFGWTVAKQMAAGSLARATAGTLLIPIDTCKTRLQFQGSMPDGEVKRYRGFSDCFRTIYREEGIRAFYRGLPARLLYIVPAAGLSFAVYEWAKRMVVSEEKKTTWQVAAPFVFGAFARVGSTSLKIPFDVVKQRLEVQGAILNKANHMYSGTLDAFRKISAQEGLARGLWTGFSVTLIRDLPFSLTYFTTYELSKHYQKVILGWLGLLGHHDLNTANHLVAGASAGCVASFVTMPIDAVKTRVQTEVLTHTRHQGEDAGAPRSRTPAHTPKKKSMLATAKVIWAQEGIRGFYRGIVPRLVSIIPSASLTFASYELYKKLLRVD